MVVRDFKTKSFMIVQREFQKEFSGFYGRKLIRSVISRFVKKFRETEIVHDGR